MLLSLRAAARASSDALPGLLTGPLSASAALMRSDSAAVSPGVPAVAAAAARMGEGDCPAPAGGSWAPSSGASPSPQCCRAAGNLKPARGPCGVLLSLLLWTDAAATGGCCCERVPPVVGEPPQLSGVSHHLEATVLLWLAWLWLLKALWTEAMLGVGDVTALLLSPSCCS